MKNTKEKLLKTAAEMFSQHGFDGVSTRELTKKSGTNLCAINYYFGSKQKLYEAVIEDMSNFISNNVVSEINRELSQIPQPFPPREEIKFILCKLFCFLCGNSISEIKIELLLRELFNPTPAYDNFYTQVFEPVHRHLSELICLDCHLEKENTKTVLLAHTLFGQVIIFKVHKEALLRRLNLKKYTPEIITEIQNRLKQNIDVILDKAKEK